jgi:hypothetical protein
MKATTCLALFMLILATSGGALFGQSSTGEISGMIADEQGAAVPGAEVSVRNAGTGEVRRFAADGSGYFLVTDLIPGAYQVSAGKAGFRRTVRDGVVLQVGQRARIDLTLSVGAVTESVEVKGETPLLDVEDATLGQVIENRKVLDLPLNGRNLVSLAALTAGVVPGNGFGGGIPYGRAALIQAAAANMQVNGSMPAENDVLIDGVPLSVCCQNQIAFLPSIDTTEEFRIHVSLYEAEYGRTGGGLLTYATKSGTNEFHGSAYEFLRNQKFDSNNFFSNLAGIGKTHFVYNQFGGRFGGRIVPNRTFFFVNYEGIRSNKGSLLAGVVPTNAQQSGVFSQPIFDPLTVQTVSGAFIRAPFPGNQIPANRIDPVAAKVSKLWPAPNFLGASNFLGSASTPDTANQVNVRIDHLLNQNQRIFGRVSLENNVGGIPDWYGNIASPAVFSSDVNNRNGVLNYTNTISPTLVLNVHYGYTRQNNVRVPRSEGTDLTQYGWPASFSNARQDATLPQFALTGYLGLSSNALFRRAGDVHNLAGDVTKIKGRHTLKFGVDSRLYLTDWINNGTAGGTFSFSTAFTRGPDAQKGTGGDAFASFLLGYPASGSITILEPFTAPQTYVAPYVQDDIRVTSKLTIHLGLRWDVETPRWETHNRLSYFNPNVTSPLASQVGIPGLRGGLEFLNQGGNPGKQQATDWNNLGPRFGLAWKIAPATVLRGGYTITYLPTTMRYMYSSNEGFSATTPFFSSVDGITPVGTLSNPFPTGVAQPAGSANGLLTNIGAGLNTLLYNDPVGYSQAWSFGVQHEFRGNVLLEASYAGSKGTKLPMPVPLDALPSQYLSLGNALLTQVANPFKPFVTSGSLSAATVTQEQLLLPFPQYLGVADGTMDLGSSTYHSLLLKMNKRFSTGFSVLAVYTAGKLLTDTSGDGALGIDATPGFQDQYNRRADKSLAPEDISQRFVASYIWELPVGHGKALLSHAPRAVDLLFGGWQLNGITTVQRGQPVVITNSVPTTSGATRPNNNGQSAEKSGSVTSRLNAYFNTSVFSAPGPFQFGNTGRVLPNVRAPGEKNFDLSVFKNFPVTEKITCQFRAEFFNIFNTPQFGEPVGTFGVSNFGAINAQLNAPRQIQFALRVSF